MALHMDSRAPGEVDLVADRALVERVQAGETDLFGTLYEQYFARLRAFCLRRVHDAHDAEEIAQEAFVKAYVALPSFGGERRFYPWVTVIASRLCVDHHRRRGRSEPTPEIDLGAVDGGQDVVFLDHDRALVRSAMERLPDRHRDILRLREEEGWSYNQIADHYGITLGAVESLLLRARRRLRREFLLLSGGEKGGLAALPLLAPILRRVKVWAARSTSGSVPAELGAMAGHAMTAAIVAVSVVAPGFLAGDDPGEPAARRVIATAGAASVAESLGDHSPVRAAESLTTSDAERGRPGPESSPSLIPAAVPGVSETNYEGTKEQAPDGQDLSEGWLGVHVQELGEDAQKRASEVTTYIDRKLQQPQEAQP